MDLGELLERATVDSTRDFAEGEPEDGAAKRFLDRHWDDPKTFLVLAEPEGETSPWGLCLTGPLEDPWTGQRSPLVLALWVDPKIRHRGVARALVLETRKLLADCGEKILSARVGHGDDALVSMGERWGFLRTWELIQR